MTTAPVPANQVTRAEFDEMLATFGPFPADMPEAAFTTKLIRYAQSRGWLAVHFRAAFDVRLKAMRTSIEGDSGWPDCVFARDGVVIFAELKAKGAYPEDDQRAWLNELGMAGYRVFVWRPCDHAEITEVLR